MTRPLEIACNLLGYPIGAVLLAAIIYMICLIGGAEWAERVVDALKEAI